MNFDTPQIVVRLGNNSRDVCIRKVLACMDPDSIIQSIANHFYNNHKVKSILLGDANCNGIYYDSVRDEVTISVTSDINEIVRYINSISTDEFELYINNSLVKQTVDHKSLSVYVNAQVTAWFERVLITLRPSAFTPIDKLFDNIVIEWSEIFDGCCRRTTKRRLL